MFAYVYHPLLMNVYLFNHVNSSLTFLSMFKRVYLCLRMLYWCLPMFTMFICAWLPMFATVHSCFLHLPLYSCLFTYDYQYLLVFTTIYSYLRMFTTVYLCIFNCIPMFTRVDLCLPFFTRVYMFTTVNSCLAKFNSVYS